MNARTILTFFLATTSILLLTIRTSYSQEILSRYATIQYENVELLKEFNSDLLLGNLSYLMRFKKNITWEDEIKNKIDVVVERVIVVLDMHPPEVRFKLVLLPSEKEVQQAFKIKYNKKVDFIAFYAPKDKTVYVSVNDVRIGVFAHELAHMVIDQFYGTATPIKVHELLAQFVETHLND